MRRRLLNCQSSWHQAKGTNNEAELRSDALKIDTTQKIHKTVDITFMKTRDLLGL